MEHHEEGADRGGGVKAFPPAAPALPAPPVPAPPLPAPPLPAPPPLQQRHCSTGVVGGKMNSEDIGQRVKVVS